jgi:DinB superfamily
MAMTDLNDVTAPPPAAADTKDWTWVLAERCPECGVAASQIAPDHIPTIVRESIPRWQAVLARDDARDRPADDVWSPLEYGCHVRDVFNISAGRARLLLAEDLPTFANWDQDETALTQRYWSQHPAAVAGELAAAGTNVAAVFAGVRDDQWARPGLRSNGSEFTVATLGQYFVHDVLHHLHDVGG